MLPGIDWLAPYLGHLSFAWIFLLLFASSFGLPIPEEVTLVAAGVLVHEGVVPFPQVFAVGLVGVLSGDAILYGLGRRYGEGILRRRVLAEWLTPDVVAWIGWVEQRYGGLALVAARFLPGLKTAAMLSAGVFGMAPRKFLLADLTGGLGSVSGALALGYVFADQVEEAVSAVNRMEVTVGGLFLLMLLAAVVRYAVGCWLSQRARPLPASDADKADPRDVRRRAVGEGSAADCESEG